MNMTVGKIEQLTEAQTRLVDSLSGIRVSKALVISDRIQEVLNEKDAEIARLREGVSAYVSDLCLRAEELQRQHDHDDAEELWAEAEKWEKLLPKKEQADDA